MFVFISVLYFRLLLISWEMKVGKRRCKCKILLPLFDYGSKKHANIACIAHMPGS